MGVGRIVLILLPALLASGAVASDEPRPDDATASFSGKMVLFGVQREPRVSGVVEILAMSPDGSALENILRVEQVSYMTGRVAPDGKRLAYGTVSVDGKSWETWVLGADGGRRKVTGEGAVMAWAPDGRSLVCAAGNHGKWKNLVIDVETGRSRPLPFPEADRIEDWAPIGDRLSVMAGNPGRVFEHPEKGTYPLRQLYTTDTTGTNRRNITGNPDLDNIWSRFSPDGLRVAHYQRRHAEGKVYESFVVRRVDGGEPVEVLQVDRLDDELRLRPPGSPYWTPDDFPCFSPDGRSLAVIVSNAKRVHRVEEQRLALLHVTMEGRVDRVVDLKKLGIVFMVGLDWK